MASRAYRVARETGFVGLAALTSLMLVTGAAGQEYGESRGTLAVTNLLEVSGDGFSAGSAVRVDLASASTGETTALSTLTSDEAGGLAGSISLPADLASGAYTLTATGVTPGGATRVLSTGVEISGVGAELTPTVCGYSIPVWVWIVLSALGLLLIGSWWLFITRMRRGGDQPTGGGQPPGETAEARWWRRQIRRIRLRWRGGKLDS